MITEYDHVLEALQLPDVFGNEVLSALTPEHTIDLLPQYLNLPSTPRCGGRSTAGSRPRWSGGLLCWC